MAKIVNNDKLTLILTHYGTTRVAEALADSTLNLNITKIKLGSGDNYEYYTPDISQEELKGPLDLEFYIYDKELLEDKETVSFHTIIPENVSGFDIREVGLYETVDGEDKLFAISTQQPFVKPSTADNYFINIDYYIFLKIANFADIYDQIVLDTEHALVSEPNLEELLRTFLFAHGNLIVQIGNNSRIIGYNRATQLYEKITEDKESFSYISLYKNYASLVDYVSSPDKIFSYWAFDYSRRQAVQNNVVDLSSNGYYLNTNEYLNNYTKTYHGFMSTLDFSAPNYFSLSSQLPLNLYDVDNNIDMPFTMIFALEPITKGVDRTLLAKSDYATNVHTFEVKELANKSLQLTLFSDTSNYVTFTSNPDSIPEGCHSIVLTYNPTKPVGEEVVAYINSNKVQFERTVTGEYTHMNEAPGTLYGYKCEPTFTAYTNENKTQFVDEMGTPLAEGPTGWELSNSVAKYKGQAASDTQENMPTLYAWRTNSVDLVYQKYIWTDDATGGYFYNEDRTVNDSGEFYWSWNDELVPFYDGQAMIRDDTQDKTADKYYLWSYEAPLAYIWTNSTSSPKLLYDQEGNLYSGNEWEIQNNKIYYWGAQATYDSTLNIATYTPNLTSYITNSNGNPSDYIDANVGLVSVVREELSEEFARIIALNLCATMGINPYISGS